MPAAISKQCPTCRAEVRKGMVRCRECGESLRRTNEPRRPSVDDARSNGGLTSGSPFSTSDAAVQDDGMDLSDFELEVVGSSSVETPPIEFPTIADVAVGHSSHRSSEKDSQPAKKRPPVTTSSTSRIDATCAGCGKAIRAACIYAGQTVACPRCGESILIPGQVVEVGSRAPLSTSAPTAKSSSFSALLERSVRAALASPPALRETPPEVVQVLSKKTLRKQLELIAAAAADPKSPHKDAALQSLQAIGASHDIGVVPDLIELFKSASGAIKQRTISTLGELPCPISFETVLAHLANASGPELAACLQALGTLGDPRAALPILYVVQLHPEQRIRGFDAIAAIGKPVSSELSRIAAMDSDSELLFAVAEVLSRFPGACPMDIFSRLMNCPSQAVRRRAAESLALVADANAVSLLIRGLDDEDAIVRMFSARGLREAPSATAAKSLLKAIDDPEREVRLAALSALGECRQQAVRLALLRRVNDADVEVAIAAAESLARIGDLAGVPRLVDILEAQPIRGDEGFALRIVEGFRKLKDKRTTLPLLNLLTCDDALLRLRAVEALGQGCDRSCRPALEKLLRFDSSDDVRTAAAKALGDLGDHDAREALEAALHDKTPVRLKAVISLGQLRAKASLPALLPLLEDPSPQVKYQTLKALGEIRDSSAIAAIEKLVDSSDDMLRRAAIKALQELGDQRGEAELRKSRKKDKKAKVQAAPAIPASRRRTNPFKKLSAPLMSTIDIVRYNRKAGVLFGGMMALAVGVVWFMFGRGNGGPPGQVIRGTVASLSMSQDGRFIATGRSRGVLEIWDVESQELAGSSTSIPTQFVAFGPEGETLLGFAGTRVAMAMVDDGYPEEPTEIMQLEAPVIAFSVNHSHTFGVTLSSDQLIYRWNLAGPKVEAPLQSSQTLMAIAVSSDGTQIAGATQQGTLVIWNFQTGDIVAETQAEIVGSITAIAFQQDGPHVAAATGDGELVLWNPESGRQPTVDDSSKSGVSVLAFPPGGEAIVCRRSGQVDRWKIENNSLVSYPSSLESITTMSAIGDQVALGSEEMTEVLVMNAGTGTLEHSLDQ